MSANVVFWPVNTVFSMKFWKVTLLTTCAFFAIATSILISSCEKDACTELKCQNGSACTGGFCRCQTGYEGAECRTKTVNRFIGTYYGFNHCDQNPSLLDTLDIRLYTDPNIVDLGLRHSYPNERFQGVADGYAITVPDQQNGSSIRKVHGELRGAEMHLFIERDDTTDAASHSVCEFVGTVQ